MSFFVLLQITATILLWGGVLLSLCLGDPSKGTTLRSAFRWGRAAKFIWLISSSATLWVARNSPLGNHLWFWTGVLTLCPFIAALGAQRPGVRVWSYFIVLPLIAVLGWPALTAWKDWTTPVPVILQLPACMGFLLVAVMGCGNYAGTRFMFPAAFAGIAAILALAPLTNVWPWTNDWSLAVRVMAMVVMALALIDAIRQGMRPSEEDSPYDRVWLDFRDYFGIVWAIRMQERINDRAQKEGWSSRLGPFGFEWNLQNSPEELQRTRQLMEHALRWHLRRFVDPGWIDERLNEAPSPVQEQ